MLCSADTTSCPHCWIIWAWTIPSKMNCPGEAFPRFYTERRIRYTTTSWCTTNTDPYA